MGKFIRGLVVAVLLVTTGVWADNEPDVTVYTISFNLDGGTGTKPNDLLVYANDTIPLAQKPETAVFTRLGFVPEADGKWYVRQGTAEPFLYQEFLFGENGTLVTRDFDLYFKWTPGHTVTFNLNGGEGVVPARINVAPPGSTLNEAQKPSTEGFTRSNHVNDGKWYTNVGTEFLFGENGTPINANTVLRLRWIPTYTVSFDLNGGAGTIPGSITDIVSGNKLNQAQMPSVDNFSLFGYTNDGKWYRRAGTFPNYTYTEFRFGDEGTTVTANTTLYLKWTPIGIPIFNETFENGENGWVLVNGSQANRWVIGQSTSNGGLSSAYITNNDIDNFYFAELASTVHIYRDITFPVSDYDFVMTYYFKGMGQASGIEYFDYMTLRYSNTDAVPMAGLIFTDGTLLQTCQGESDWVQKRLILPATIFSGKTMRLVFTWINDDFGATQPPAAIDDISIQPMCIVKFDLNGGTGTLPEDIYVKYGSTIEESQMPVTTEFTRSGFIDYGNWYTRTGTSEANYVYTRFVFGENGTAVTANTTTLYLRWGQPRTVSFDLNGGTGTAPANITVANGNTLSESQMPSTETLTRRGYVNDGNWYVREMEGVTRNLIVEYVVSGGSSLGMWNANSDVQGYSGEFVELNNPRRWRIGVRTGDFVCFTLISFSSIGGFNITYSVRWEDSPNTFLINRPLNSSMVGGSIGCISGPPAVPRNTYPLFEFGDNGTKVMENITLRLKWTLEEYNITYNLNGGENPTNVSVKYNITSNSITLPTPTKTGFTFGGWFNNEDFSGTSITSIPSGSTGDINLYARWTPTNFTITYNLNNGTNHADNPTSFTIECEKITLNSPTRIGFIFAGWFTNSSFTGEAITTIPTGSTGNRTLWARWTLNTYTVIFDPNGGTVMPETGTTGTGWRLASLPTPTKTGYTFNGWFTEKTEGTLVATSTAFIGDTTIYAQWTLIAYTITYNLNSGTNHADNPTSFTVECEDITLLTPTRAGHTFGGWFGNSQFTGEAITSIPAGGTGNIALWARWTLDVYTIMFNANGGTVTPATGTTNNRWQLGSLPTPTRTDYTFNGWFTEETGGTRVTTSTTFSADATIFAQWTYNWRPWSEWQTTVASTCVREGTQRRTRTSTTTPPETQTETRSIPALGHNWGTWIEVDTTFANACVCTEAIERRICQRCASAQFRVVPLLQGSRCTDDLDKPNEQENLEIYGIILENTIVSDMARIFVKTPEPATANITILDNLGNAVFTASTMETQTLRLYGGTASCRDAMLASPLANCGVVWNLRNTAGRLVANGTYLIIVEARGNSGRAYRYSARIGVQR
jgi:uncharacterized repeat protein (TIGR02543 family)